MSSEDLQFDKADFKGGAALKCAMCKEPIEGDFYQINGHTVCPPCRERASADFRGGEPATRFGMAFGAGLVAAIAGVFLYWGVEQLTNREWSLIAIAVGWMVGYAVNWGARNRGGLPYQCLAVLLTYSAIAASDVPDVLRWTQSSVGVVECLEAFVHAATLPWTGGSNILLWIIIAFGLHQAWSMNREVKLEIAGPFSARQSTPPAAS